MLFCWVQSIATHLVQLAFYFEERDPYFAQNVFWSKCNFAVIIDAATEAAVDPTAEVAGTSVNNRKVIYHDIGEAIYIKYEYQQLLLIGWIED